MSPFTEHLNVMHVGHSGSPTFKQPSHFGGSPEQRGGGSLLPTLEAEEGQVSIFAPATREPSHLLDLANQRPPPGHNVCI